MAKTQMSEADDMIYDVIISGGGMVGSALALALGQAGMQVALIEKQAAEPLYTPFSSNEDIDLRVSSINLASESWLKQLGAWQQLSQMRLCPYRRLQAFESSTSTVTFTASEIGRSHLGHIVENNLLQRSLWQQLPANVKTFGSASIVSLQQDDTLAQVTLDNDQLLKAQLIVAAEGANSLVRQLAGVGTTGWQYQQSCLVALVNTPYPQQDVTWQQFTEHGPRAFLPLSGSQASLVWYDEAEKVRKLAAMSPGELQQQIKHVFPEQVGAVEVVKSSWFPLARMHVNQYFKQRVVLAGDAAHTINPLAGQGVNLGFADAKLLTQLLVDAKEQGIDLASPALLQRYQRKRYRANLAMMSAMDGFYQVFSNDILPVRKLRQLALNIAAHSTVLKNIVARYAVGAE